MFSKSEEYALNGVKVVAHKSGRLDIGTDTNGEPAIILTQWLDKATNEYRITGTIHSEEQKALLEKAMPNINITPNGIVGQWNVRS